MIHSRGANASDAEVVWTQILQGMGGGAAAVTQQVGAQAGVPHVDVAMVTAVVLLVTEIGGAVGSAAGVLICHLKNVEIIVLSISSSRGNMEEHHAH